MKMIKRIKIPKLDRRYTILPVTGFAAVLTVALAFGLIWDYWQDTYEIDITTAAFDAIPETEKCLAQAIYFEARGEPFEGQLAVANVILNRVRDSKFPGDICSVVFQGEHRRNACQFSFACDGKSDRPANRRAWAEALTLAKLAGTGRLRDQTESALYYHANYVKPSWAEKFIKTRTIGQHSFYRPK